MYCSFAVFYLISMMLLPCSSKPVLKTWLDDTVRSFGSHDSGFCLIHADRSWCGGELLTTVSFVVRFDLSEGNVKAF